MMMNNEKPDECVCLPAWLLGSLCVMSVRSAGRGLLACLFALKQTIANSSLARSLASLLLLV